MPEIPINVLAAVNPGLIGKNGFGSALAYSEGWLNVELPLGEFIDAVHRGWAYCPQLNGSRKAENFRACNIDTVDIGHGMTLERRSLTQLSASTRCSDLKPPSA